jgi:putative sigma-54 modulation protein
MQINIQSLSFHPSDKLTDFTLDKVNKLTQYTDRISHAEVVLKTDKSDTRDNRFCEIRLSIPGNDLFASRQQPTFEEAVLKTVEALKQQLLTWKEKTQDRTHTASSDVVQSDD